MRARIHSGQLFFDPHADPHRQSRRSSGGANPSHIFIGWGLVPGQPPLQYAAVLAIFRNPDATARGEGPGALALSPGGTKGAKNPEKGNFAQFQAKRPLRGRGRG